MNLIVHKFGGTSLNDAERILSAAREVAISSRQNRCVVVVSAMGGSTDRLLSAAKDAEKGELGTCRAVAEELRKRHLIALEDLKPSSEQKKTCSEFITAQFDEFESLCHGVASLKELSARTLDLIVARGERLSSRLMAIALEVGGSSAVAVDAAGVVITDDHFGEAAPDFETTRKKAEAMLVGLDQGTIPVVTGFIGGTLSGETTTLGRGGSDYSASILGAVLKASEVHIWTDVDGVFTADPRAVPNARIIPQLNYREASELSYYGAKVLHPRTIIPLARERIPLLIRNSFAPEHPGTVVNDLVTLTSHSVKAVTSISSQSMISVDGKGMLGVPGLAARVFGAMAEDGVSVTMISQSSSENNICFTIPADAAKKAVARLKRALERELMRGDIENISSLDEISIVAAVGLGMKGTPGVAARIFGALFRHQINVIAIAQGSSELNVSLVVSSAGSGDAVRALHDEFHLDRLDTFRAGKLREFDLILLGLGNVGRAFLAQVKDQGDYFREKLGIQLNIVELIDRRGFVARPEGIERNDLDRILDSKANGRALSDVLGGKSYKALEEPIRSVCEYRLSRPIVIDFSDGPETLDVLLVAISKKCHVILANKKPLSGSLASFRNLIDAAEKAHRKIRFEATVGAGLPILNTLAGLTGTGDELRRVEGCFSGTLGFLSTAIEEGKPFSAAVAEARSLGYTEPDPWEDLSGRDVARKSIILARLIGNPCESEHVKITSFVPNGNPPKPGDDLIRHLKSFDDEFAKRVSDGKAAGTVLRYVAEVTPQAVSVGLKSVPTNHPLAQLRGTDNMVVFFTDRYSTNPLVVRGPGAGADVTASGVLSDLLAITSSE